jgi:signal transduction histidine kinase
MITIGGNQRRVRTASAPAEFPATSAGHAETQIPSEPTPRALRRSAGLGQDHSFSTLDRLRGRQRDREQHAVADALARERSRIAADVHDLVMQDLALALATARALADGGALTSHASTVVAAGERALAGAREIVGGLVDRHREPVVEAVGASVRVAARHVPLSFHADGIPARVQPDQPTLDALVHIGREAVTNAVKHGEPIAVEVILEHGEEWRLQVCDDGRGFDSTDAAAGFGLESMQRHAHALGGTLRVISAADAGTTVEAILP